MFGRRLLLPLLSLVAVTMCSIESAWPQSSPPTRWLYPGQPLPAGISFVPMSLNTDGTSPQPKRDWFLLRQSGFFLGRGPNQIRDFYGPALSDTNAQVYFRIASGMILKAAMVQMGMDAGEARLLLDRVGQSGKTFDSLPISELGTLPRGLDDLYARWDRPIARLAIEPYLILPLSIADYDSGFQHFYAAPINANSDKSCSTIDTAAPFASIQKEIDDRRGKLEDMGASVTQATSLLEQSNNERDRLRAKAQALSTEIQMRTDCIKSLNTRITHGSGTTTSECLGLAKTTMAEAKLSDIWEKFVSANMQNPSGDYSDFDNAKADLDTLQIKQKVETQTLADLTDGLGKDKQNLQTEQGKLTKLKSDKLNQDKILAELKEKEAPLKTELKSLQTIRFELDQERLSDTDATQANADTPSRNKRIEELKKALAQIEDEENRKRLGSGTIDTQIDSVTRTADDLQSQVTKLTTQIGVITGEMAELDSQVARAKSKYFKADEAFKFSDYVVNALSNKVIALQSETQTVDASIKATDETNARLTTALAVATAANDKNSAGLRKELATFESQLVNYRNDDHMGWFLELDCIGRERIDNGKPGIFLARAPETIKGTPAGVIEGGQWGLFNMSYAHFQKAIDEKGILLNFSDYLHLAIEQFIKNLDSAYAQYLEPSAPKCGDTSGQSRTATTDLMGTAFAVWNDANDGAGDDAARGKTVCKNGDVKKNFVKSLNRFLAFTGTVLDQTLPRSAAADGAGLQERQAIEDLTADMRILTGMTKDDDSLEASHQRRDGLIRALIQVLATNYDQAITSSLKQQATSDIHLASQAPGDALSPPLLAKLQVNETAKAQRQVGLYSAPQVPSNHDAGLLLKVGDPYKLLTIEDDSSEVTRAGWLRIQIGDDSKKTYFVVASALLAAPPTAAALPTTPPAVGAPPLPATIPTPPPAPRGDPTSLIGATPVSSTDCPLRRLVTSLHGTKLDRAIPEIRLSRVPAQGYWRLNFQESRRTSPAGFEKTYVACELYTDPSKLATDGTPTRPKSTLAADLTHVFGVRILEVRSLGNGKYLRLEPYGGFVTAWLLANNGGAVFRVDLGPQLDATALSDR